MPGETGWGWGGQAALHRAGFTCSCTKSQRKGQRSKGRSCPVISCYRILVSADHARNRAKRSASQIARKGESSAVMCHLNSLRNHGHVEPAGAPFTSLLCTRNQAHIRPFDTCLMSPVPPMKSISFLTISFQALKVRGLFLLRNFYLFCYKSGRLLLVLQMFMWKANHHHSLYSLLHSVTCHVPPLLRLLFPRLNSSSSCNFYTRFTFPKPLILFSGIKLILKHNL